MTTSGPVRTLPGAKFKPTEGSVCDDHPDRPAVKRVQGETDSFGAEFHNLCAECVAEMDASKVEGHCDCCGKTDPDLKPTRDPDEGSCGPVYWVCDNCVPKYQYKD